MVLSFDLLRISLTSYVVARIIYQSADHLQKPYCFSLENFNFAFLPQWSRTAGTFPPDFTTHLARTSAISDLRVTTSARRSLWLRQERSQRRYVTTGISANHQACGCRGIEDAAIHGVPEERVVVLLVVVNSCRASHRFDHASMLIAARRPLVARRGERKKEKSREVEKKRKW